MKNRDDDNHSKRAHDITYILRKYAELEKMPIKLKCVLAEAAATIESLRKEIESLKNRKMRLKYSCEREEVDSGCKYADNCFDCPFPDCILTTRDLDDTEDEAMAKRHGIVETAMLVNKLHDSGMDVKKIASVLDRDIPLVKRDLIIAREEMKRNAEQAGHREG